MLNAAACVSPLSDVVRHRHGWLLPGVPWQHAAAVPAWHTALLPRCSACCREGACAQLARCSSLHSALTPLRCCQVLSQATPGQAARPQAALGPAHPHCPKSFTLPWMFCLSDGVNVLWCLTVGSLQDSHIPP